MGLRSLSAVTDEPRDPTAHTEVHRVADPSSTRVASYLAEPGEDFDVVRQIDEFFVTVVKLPPR